MLCHSWGVVLPPPYQRPPGAEIPAMGFAVVLKILVKANLLSSRQLLSCVGRMYVPSCAAQEGAKKEPTKIVVSLKI